MAIDSSALVAIMLEEPEAEAFLEILGSFTGELVIGAPTMFETLMVLEGKGYLEATDAISPLLRRHAISIVPFDSDLVHIANDAFLRFGKKLNPAGLNFGDCMAYAVAKSLDAPLLFKGEDFPQTDIVPAI